ncbi:MAG: Ppx/GppA phosphatase family protein [Fibrobacterota bacterium]
MRLAILDLGTNTLVTLIVEVRETRFSVLYEKERIVGLGKGIGSTGAIPDDSLERAVLALREAATECVAYKTDTVLFTATAVLRDASNAAVVKARLEREGGHPITVLSGEEEARLSYLAGARTFPRFTKLTVIDIGGGSVEFIEGEGGRIRKLVSLPLGVVKMTERFLTGFPARENELSALDAHLHASLSDALSGYTKGPGVTLVGVAGTFTTAAAMEMKMTGYDPARITGFALTRSVVESWRERTSSMALDAQKKLPGLHPKRAGYIVAGFSLMRAIFDVFGTDTVVVSDAGLRYGVLYDWMGKQ